MAVIFTSVRRAGFFALAGLAGSVLASSGAFAQVTTTFQNCTTTQFATPTTITNIGGSQPHQNMQPYLTISFCVALQGIFPSQN